MVRFSDVWVQVADGLGAEQFVQHDEDRPLLHLAASLRVGNFSLLPAGKEMSDLSESQAAQVDEDEVCVTLQPDDRCGVFGRVGVDGVRSWVSQMYGAGCDSKL